MAKFLMELCVTEYSMLQFLPSHIAAAALNLAMKAYNAGEWVSTVHILISIPHKKTGDDITKQHHSQPFSSRLQY